MAHLIQSAFDGLLRCAEDPETDWEQATKDRRHAMNAVLDLRDCIEVCDELAQALRDWLEYDSSYSMLSWDQLQYRVIAALSKVERRAL